MVEKCVIWNFNENLIYFLEDNVQKMLILNHAYSKWKCQSGFCCMSLYIPGTHKTINYLVEHGVTVFPYILNYTGQFSFTQAFTGFTVNETFGVCHGDDLIYMFDPLADLGIRFCSFPTFLTFLSYISGNKLCNKQTFYAHFWLWKTVGSTKKWLEKLRTQKKCHSCLNFYKKKTRKNSFLTQKMTQMVNLKHSLRSYLKTPIRNNFSL